MIKQISIFIENKAGRLAEITAMLAAEGVDIRALSISDTTDFGIVRMIVDDHEKAKEILTGKGHVVNVSQVVAVCVPDRPGGMAEVMAVLDKAGASIEYSYAFAFHKGEKAVLVFRFADNATAARALADAGWMTLDESEIGK